MGRRNGTSSRIVVSEMGDTYHRSIYWFGFPIGCAILFLFSAFPQLTQLWMELKRRSVIERGRTAWHKTMTFIQMPINKSAAAKRLATIGDNRGSSDFGLGGRPWKPWKGIFEIWQQQLFSKTLTQPIDCVDPLAPTHAPLVKPFIRRYASIQPDI